MPSDVFYRISRVKFQLPEAYDKYIEIIIKITRLLSIIDIARRF